MFRRKEFTTPDRDVIRNEFIEKIKLISIKTPSEKLKLLSNNELNEEIKSIYKISSAPATIESHFKKQLGCQTHEETIKEIAASASGKSRNAENEFQRFLKSKTGVTSLFATHIDNYESDLEQLAKTYQTIMSVKERMSAYLIALRIEFIERNREEIAIINRKL